MALEIFGPVATMRLVFLCFFGLATSVHVCQSYVFFLKLPCHFLHAFFLRVSEFTKKYSTSLIERPMAVTAWRFGQNFTFNILKSLPVKRASSKIIHLCTGICFVPLHCWWDRLWSGIVYAGETK